MIILLTSLNSKKEIHTSIFNNQENKFIKKIKVKESIMHIYFNSVKQKNYQSIIKR
jgi:hypothetical protein